MYRDDNCCKVPEQHFNTFFLSFFLEHAAAFRDTERFLRDCDLDFPSFCAIMALVLSLLFSSFFFL